MNKSLLQRLKGWPPTFEKRAAREEILRLERELRAARSKITFLQSELDQLRKKVTP